MRMIGLLLALSIAAPAAARLPLGDTLVLGSETESIAGKNERHDRMTVPVRIGEHGTFAFLIDTGAQRTVISNELAARFSVPAHDRKRIVGVAGAAVVDTAILDELALGRRSFFGMEVLLFEGRNIGADGIVGIDSLQDQRVLLDFAANSMRVGDAVSQGGNSGFEIVVRARRRGGQLIVTDAEIDGVRTAVVIDTGAASSVGNRALQRALRHRGAFGKGTLVSVTGHEAPADVGSAGKMVVGGVGISNPVIAFSDSPAFTTLDLDRRPALMLGMRELRLFRRVAIDFSKRKVYFDLPAQF